MIRLQFVTEAGLGAWAIRWFSAGPVSHVDAVLDDGRLVGARNDRITLADGAVIDAGVQARPPDYAKFTRRYGFEIAADAAVTDRFYRRLHEQIGKPYDMSAIVGFAAGRNWRDPTRWFCSELQAWLLEKAEILPRLFTPTNKVTPTALAEVLSGHPGVTYRRTQ